MAKLNRPNGKLFGSSATNIGVFGSGQTSNPTTSTNPDTINTLGTHWEDGWNGAVVSQAPYTAPFVEDMNAVNYVNSYNGAYLLQQGIPEYSKNADYYVDSVCTYNGKIYMCILDNPAVNPDPDDPDPDAPPINYPLTDTTHWNERVELPDMNDNEVLVGSVGGTGVATDTLNQGDIVASSGGLDIKAGVIINADVKSDAAIEESKLALDHSTDSLNTAITNKSISNLKDTNITTPIGAGDVIAYDDVNSEWINSNALANHLTDTNNPHDTSMANLDDTNVNDRQTLADGDVMVYDLANTDWVNSPSLSNHLTNTNNPHTTTLANLDDTTITTPQDGETVLYDSNSSKWINSAVPGGALSSLTDVNLGALANKELLQYDYANSKWVNSSDVWSTIEVNELANIRSATSTFTMTDSDKHQQILDSTTGYDIILPSTNIKTGATYIFRWTDAGTSTLFSPTFVFKSSNNSTIGYAYNGLSYYIFTAVVDNPTTPSNWSLKTIPLGSVVATGTSYGSRNLAANSQTNYISSVFLTLTPGFWYMSTSFAYLGGYRSADYNTIWFTSLRYSSGNNPVRTADGNCLGVAFSATLPYTKGTDLTLGSTTVNSAFLGSVCKSGTVRIGSSRQIIFIDNAWSSGAATGAAIRCCVEASFLGSITTTL